MSQIILTPNFEQLYILCDIYIYRISLQVFYTSGHIDVAEIELSLHSLGVNVSTEQASRILQRLDQLSTKHCFRFVCFFSA